MLDIVNMFFCGEVSSIRVIRDSGRGEGFTVEEINELYGLPNDPDAYPGQRLIVKPTEGEGKKIF